MNAVPPGFNGTVRLIAAPAAGTFAQVLLTKASVRAIVVRESIVTTANAAQAAQGFQVKCQNDNSPAGFTSIFARPPFVSATNPGDWPKFEYYNIVSEHGPHGEPIGPYDGATAVLLVSSLTQTPTTLEVWEYA